MYLVLDNLDRSLICRQINILVAHRYTLKWFLWLLKWIYATFYFYGTCETFSQRRYHQVSTLTIPSWPNCNHNSRFMWRKCFHFYFCWDTLLLRDFLHIPNSPFPLLTTSIFLRITADRQNSVWLDKNPYRREVETNADNSRNFKSL